MAIYLKNDSFSTSIVKKPLLISYKGSGDANNP